MTEDLFGKKTIAAEIADGFFELCELVLPPFG
jgi:hypothetical protein